MLNASVLRGSLRWRLPDHQSLREDYQYLEQFLHQQPVASAGYSIRIYHLDCDQANALRAELGLELLDCDEQP